MRHLAAALILAALAAPASAEWTINGTTATWYAEKPTAVVEEARDAILWQRSRQPLVGAIFTAALPQLSVTDAGGGNGRINIVMGRNAFDNWSAAIVAVICPEAGTNAEKLACLDAAIKADVRQVIYRYRQHLREEALPPVEEPPEL